MEALLAELKKRYPLYLLSNTNAMHFDHIRKTYPHLFRHFRIAFPSHRVGHRKPDRQIYDAVLARIGLRPEDTIFIDDSPKFIEGAKKVGIHGILFRNILQLKKELKKYSIHV